MQVDIPGFIAKVAEGDFIGAARHIKQTNALPAVCGRVCPQEVQCEQRCVRGKKGDPVAIGRLERFAADFERATGDVAIPAPATPTGKKVAIVGSGPSGLTVAGDLVQLGHDVTIFEALHKPGGVLVYGIPEFRLPKAIVAAEVDYLQKLGVKINTSFVVARPPPWTSSSRKGMMLLPRNRAGLPTFMKIGREPQRGLLANDICPVNLMKA